MQINNYIIMPYKNRYSVCYFPDNVNIGQDLIYIDQDKTNPRDLIDILYNHQYLEKRYKKLKLEDILERLLDYLKIKEEDKVLYRGFLAAKRIGEL